MYFFIEDDDLLKNIMILEIKPSIISNTNLAANTSTIKDICKPNWHLTVMRLQIFMIQICQKAVLNHTCLAVILIDTVL